MTTPRKRGSEFRKTPRCPVCGAAGCLVCGPHKSPIAVVCKRTTSSKPVGNVGWLHLVDRRGPVFQFTRAGIELMKIAREASG